MNITTFLNRVMSLILNPLILLMFSLSFLYFVYSVIRFLSAEPGDKSRIEARDSMIWGILGMAVMFSVYGLIRFVLATFGIDISGNTTVSQIIR